MTMKLFYLYFLLLLEKENAQDVFDLDYGELLGVGVSMLDIRLGDVKETDVELYLYTRKNKNEPIQLDLHGENKKFNVNKPTKVLIHGFLENYLFKYYIKMRTQYLNLFDVNFIAVNWKRVALSEYMSAAQNTKLIGEIIGNFFARSGIPAKNLHLIGFSLGSHVAGFTAKTYLAETNKRPHRITALDPAGPYFRMSQRKISERLHKEDADIIDVYHTDGEFFGYMLPIGTLDIYVNGGKRKQPGCNDSEPGFSKDEMLLSAMCSHTRAPDVFISGINSTFKCYLCDTFEDMKIKMCSEDTFIKIIKQNIVKENTGICYLSTS